MTEESPLNENERMARQYVIRTIQDRRAERKRASPSSLTKKFHDQAKKLSKAKEKLKLMKRKQQPEDSLSSSESSSD